MNPQDVIAELNAVIARIEMERMAAVEHLFCVLDGPERETAMAEARAWLKEKYGDSCGMLSAVCQRMRATDAEWPAEL